MPNLPRALLTESAPNKAVEPTPNSLRSYVAAAIGRGSPRALGAFHTASLNTNALDRCFTWRYSGAYTMEEDALWQ